jgi:hypothetical protein
MGEGGVYKNPLVSSWVDSVVCPLDITNIYIHIYSQLRHVLLSKNHHMEYSQGVVLYSKMKLHVTIEWPIWHHEHLYLAFSSVTSLSFSTNVLYKSCWYEINQVSSNNLMFYVLGAGLTIYYIVKIKFKQWWSRIPPISTKQTITSHPNSLNINKDNNIIMMLEMQVLAWDKYTNRAGLNQLMGSTHSISLNKIDIQI